MYRLQTLFLLASLCACFAVRAAVPSYDAPFFPGARYADHAPDPGDCLGFPVGQRAATPAEIGHCLEAWSGQSDRMHLETYATSHEGRPLYYVVLGSPDNVARRDEIRDKLGQIADPRDRSASEIEPLLAEVPAVAWLGHSIHGDETSGADAALALIYHLAFDQSDETRELLDETLVIIDPMMNPDGRHRFLQQVAEYRSERSNVDDQSLIHTGYWPWGRTNHYLFDLNRDWAFGVHPETRGRMRAVNRWHPLLFVDAHEMGPQDSYLFSPPRDPHNPHLPEWQLEWNRLFARDQAAAFDERGWRYYTGEWNEGWYPGYSDAWASLGGAVGILYEQAGVAHAGVRQGSGQILTYRESVHHQATSAIANLRTLAANANELKAAWAEQRRRSVSADGPYAERTFAILPTENQGRLRAFLELMDLHGIEVHRLPREISVGSAEDQLGRQRGRLRLPEGTLLIPNRQPNAHRVAAMLEFDLRIPDETLTREREKLLREGTTRIYDVTAWNLTMMHGLPALSLPTGLPGEAEPLDGLPPQPAMEPEQRVVGWFFNGHDDRSLKAAAHLLQSGVNVRLARKDTRLAGTAVPAGSPMVLKDDNRALDDALAGELASAAQAAGLSPTGVASGLGPRDLPDLGGEHFPLLKAPRVAVASRGGFSAYDFGAIWHHLDRRIALTHSHIEESRLAEADLRRYNVIVLPDRWGDKLDSGVLEVLDAWVRAGGTLIAVGQSAAQLAAPDSTISHTRLLPDVVDDPLPYRIALVREWQAARGDMPDPDAVWSHQPPEKLDYPWQLAEPEAGTATRRKPARPADSTQDSEEPRPDATPAQRRDTWQALFMPQGALLAGRMDEKSWLTIGGGDYLPVLAGDAPVLMAADKVAAPVRYGVLLPGREDSDEPIRQIGWAPIPADHELRLRMSGLLWPEAAHRLANAAWLTREAVDRGQVILLASPPVFRGATLGAARIFSNAVLYGPGLGASAPIEPRAN